MSLLSSDEAKVWLMFQQGKPTSMIAEDADEGWTPAYVSRVLNRARSKIEGALKEYAESHRLDVEKVLDYHGLLLGFDYQANAQVYIAYTERQGIIVWYRHSSYAGTPCSRCPKEADCADTLNTVEEEYGIHLSDEERALPHAERSTLVFEKLAAKEVPRYQRSRGGEKNG